MKLPRWLVIVLQTTSVIGLFAAMWWWLTWPDRTLRDFRRLIEDGKFAEANALIVQPDERWINGTSVISGRFMQSEVTDEFWGTEKPSVADLIAGRRTLKNIEITIQWSTISVTTEDGVGCRFKIKED